jgi:outer membrane protein
MRKSVLLMILLFAVGMTASAQKFALIDMEYILKNIPAYERANEQLNQAIVAKEKEAAELRRTYFGPEGELFKKRESLMQPIQDEIYNAVKEISEQKGYSVVVDRASATSIIFASPRIDISNEVLEKLGYSN